jgi:isopenicillin N synthase-like dioxygenase
MHGRNLFPALPGFQETTLEYLSALTRLGHVLMRGIALSLGRESDYFASDLTRDPFILFRIFNYPAGRLGEDGDSRWGVGEHTDYGLLTILRQDDIGGLEIRTRDGWIDAPPIPDSFVCNIGDMLERMTLGLYRSTPHRVRNTSTRDRLSFPFFFDPGFDAQVHPIPGLEPDRAHDPRERWDHTSVHEFRGTYGDYLLAKVARVFPDLGRSIT